MLLISKCEPDEVQPKDRYFRGSRFCEVELNSETLNLDAETIIQFFKMSHIIPKCVHLTASDDFTGIGASDNYLSKLKIACSLVERLCNEYNTPITLIVPVSESAQPNVLNSHVTALCSALECGELALTNCAPYNLLNKPNTFGADYSLLEFLKQIHRPNVGLCVDIRNLKANKTELRPFFCEASDYIMAVRVAGGNYIGPKTITSRLLLKEINNAIVASNFDGLTIIDVSEEDGCKADNFSQQFKLIEDYCTFDFMW